MFRSSTAAERAEAEGRVDDAARLYIESGDRPEAVRVLLRAGETARTLAERRAFYARAYGLARSDDLRDAARKGLALVTLAECEATAPRSEEDRLRLVEAGADLERLGAFKEAGRAYGILEDRDGVVRVLTLAGDVESLTRETDTIELSERMNLRRRAALEAFDMLWRSGDRERAVRDLRQWVQSQGTDHEARKLLDGRSSLLPDPGRVELTLDGTRYTLVGRFPVVLGREGDVVLRGGSVSRRHAMISRTASGTFVLEDAGSRAGTLLDGVPVAAPVPLVAGHAVHLGGDLVLRVRAIEGDAGFALEVERGMDRGRVIALVASRWPSPLGDLRFGAVGAVLEPAAAVSLNGQKVVAAINLARDDRVEAAGHALAVVG